MLGGDLPVGTPVLVGHVDGRRVHAPADLSTWQERWPVADGRWTGHVVERWTDGGGGGQDADVGFVVVGCDPALALAAAHLPARGPQRLVAVNGSTRTALAALEAGHAHAALVHGRPGTLPPAPAGTLRVPLARWRVGLAAGGSTRPRSLTRLTHDAQGALVQREPGASSQQALLRALDAEGVPAPAGPVATGHVAVTLRVLAGAPAGVTMEPAALHAGLAFLPLETHTVELWVAPGHREHPGADALTHVLASRAFTRRLDAIGGYDHTATALALTETPA